MVAKRILIPVAGFGKAGGFRVLSELANYWIKSGNQVDFLVHRRYAKPYFPTQAGVRTLDAPDELIAGNGNAADPKKEPWPGSIYFEMFRALRKIGSKYDVVVANHSLTAFPVAFAKCGSARKYYYVQAYEPEYYRAKKTWKSRVPEVLAALSYSLPLRQIANSPIYLGYKHISATSWVPPGIDLQCFHRRSAMPMFSDGHPWTVGTIGRHEPTKGTKYVLEAFEKLAAIDANVHLKVAFGNLPSEWSHERVEIVVPQNDRELAEYYRSVDVLVAPGTVQLGACHYPVLEAMACGTPVITTGYIPADSSNAWIVPVCDSSAIVDALLDIRATAPQTLEAKLTSAAEAITSFEWSRVAENFLSHFEDGN